MKKKQKPTKKNRIQIISRNGNVVKNTLNQEEQNQLERLLEMQIRQTILNAFKGPMFDIIGPEAKKKLIDSIEKQMENNNQAEIDTSNLKNQSNPKRKKSPLKRKKTSNHSR